MQTRLGPTPHKVHLGTDGRAVILCPKCGQTNTMDASRYKNVIRPLKVKCSCGFIFTVSLEKRQHYRKEVHLNGALLSPEAGETAPGFGMVVKNISRTGIGFETVSDASLKVGDIIKVRFVLDDASRSLISKNVIVKLVQGRFIGAEFCDDAQGRTLAFYLMV